MNQTILGRIQALTTSNEITKSTELEVIYQEFRKELSQLTDKQECRIITTRLFNELIIDLEYISSRCMAQKKAAISFLPSRGCSSG